MSDYALREGSLLLFPNERKTGKQPDFKGEGLVNGKAYEFAMWRKEGVRGEFFSMSFKEKQQHRDPPPRKEPELPLVVPPADPSDEIGPEGAVPF